VNRGDDLKHQIYCEYALNFAQYVSWHDANGWPYQRGNHVPVIYTPCTRHDTTNVAPQDDRRPCQYKEQRGDGQHFIVAIIHCTSLFQADVVCRDHSNMGIVLQVVSQREYVGTALHKHI
jgi:hypothetical protein